MPIFFWGEGVPWFRFLFDGTMTYPIDFFPVSRAKWGQKYLVFVPKYYHSGYERKNNPPIFLLTLVQWDEDP